MSDETATTEHPRAALPAGGTTALLYDTALVLVRARTRRRIPFEAVERVDGPGGADGRALRIERDRMGLPAHTVLAAAALTLLWLGLDLAVPTALGSLRVLRDSWRGVTGSRSPAS